MKSDKKILKQQDHRPNRAPYKQLYRSAWEEVAEFKDWIAPVADNPSKAYCKFCERELHSHRLSLLKHCSSLKHEVRLKELQQFVGKAVVPLGLKETTSIIPTCSSEKPVQNYGMKYTSCPSTSKSSVSKKNLTKIQTRLANRRPRTPSLDTSNSSDKNDFKNNCEQEDFHLEEDPWVDNENNDHNEEEHQNESLDSVDQNDGCCTPFSKTDGPTPTPISALMASDRPPITTHILDTSRGKPASGIKVLLYKLEDSLWTIISESVTNTDGRCSDLLSRSAFTVGRYKLHFDVGNYFKELQIDSLYPFIEIVFDCSNDGKNHYHIPLLLNPFGYSTYRGT